MYESLYKSHLHLYCQDASKASTLHEKPKGPAAGAKACACYRL